MIADLENRDSRILLFYAFSLRFALLNLVDKIAPKVAKAAEFDSFSHPAHRVRKESQIMMRNQDRRQHFACLIQMPQISSRIAITN